MLDSAHQYPVTVIIAGPGYGKSVALDHWIALEKTDTVRYDVREGSHGVFDFALGLARSFGHKAKLGNRAIANAVNAAENSSSPELDLAVWFGNFLKKFAGTIVIDDYHVAAADDPAVSKFMGSIIERTQENVRWVIASRSLCGLPISSWIAYGKSQMALGERELTFTHEEAAATAAEFGAVLSMAQVNELFAYTGGWPTGHTFALLSAERTLDLQELQAATQEMSYQYLAEQVLRGIPDDEADFLVRSSVFERLDLPTLTHFGIDRPRARMQYLKEQGTFIVAEADGSLRYHDLFRDFLRSVLAQRDSSFRQTWRAAGATHEALNQFVQALNAYQTAGDVDTVVRIIEERGFQLIEHGQRRAVVRALTAVGDSFDRADHPLLLALRATCELNGGNAERAEAWYREAISFARRPVERARMCLQFARELGERNRLDNVDILEPCLRDELPAELKASIMGSLATYYWQANRRDESRSLIDDALRIASAVDNDEVHAVLLHQSAYILLMSNRIPEATDRAMRALDVAKPLDLHALCARIQSLLFYIHVRADNVAQALWWLKQMERSATEAGDIRLMFSALISTYELEVERANLTTLPRLAEQLRGFDSHQYHRTSATLLPSFAMQAAWQRRFEEALTILGQSETDQVTAQRRAFRASEIALYAAAAGKRGRAETSAGYALDQLRLKDESEPHSARRQAKTLVFLGLSQLLLGKVALANRHISAAERLPGPLSDRCKTLIKAARAMFVHVETRTLDEDVEAAFEALKQHSYEGLAKMLRELPMPAIEKSGTTAVLTKTEVEVLRALERFGESKAAALELGKSPHTIDWHVKSIMKKLAVSTRREAILFARDRGLIG
ncbi:MAG: LuxR C-terminal-related transcriptional regulator [Candidatus Eremiobacteraeota bacterium]|nr:LuxR C-terminal-related transcriptional regulator [Candidatus Eremiobacteraeota bacterium]